ncbi:MAG: PilN domain-containing protein [Gemmatimonadota bacterium]
MPSDSFRLVIGPVRIAADLSRKGQVVWAGQTEYAGLEDLTDAIARLVAEPEVIGSLSRVRVELERPLVQCRTLVDLPTVPVNALRPMVEQQAHRYFRKNGKPLIVDALRANGKGSGVEAAAVEEPVVEAIWAGVRAAGFRLEDVAPSGYVGRLSLHLPAERARRRREARLSLRRLSLAVGILWLMVVGATWFNLVRQRREIDRELARLADPVAALALVKGEIALGQGMISAVDLGAEQRDEMVRLLAAMTAALPDSAFITSLSLKHGGRGFVGGYSKRASEVLARLESSGAVVAPRLDGLVAREVIAGSEWERFSITFGEEKSP